MKTPWTPGPWTTCGASDHKCACGLVWDASGNIPVAAARDGRQDDILLPEDQHRANATLIAAAPDLAEALANLLEASLSMRASYDALDADEAVECVARPMDVACDAARAALRKAGALWRLIRESEAVSAKVVQAFAEEDQELVTLERAIASALEEAVAQEREECAALAWNTARSDSEKYQDEGEAGAVAVEGDIISSAIRARGTP